MSDDVTVDAELRRQQLAAAIAAHLATSRVSAFSEPPKQQQPALSSSAAQQAAATSDAAGGAAAGNGSGDSAPHKQRSKKDKRADKHSALMSSQPHTDTPPHTHTYIHTDTVVTREAETAWPLSLRR